MRQPIDYFVMDSLANDIEAIEDILRMLNSDTVLGWRDHHPEPFTREEIVPVLLRSIRRGDVEAFVWSEEKRELIAAEANVIPDGSLDEVWFGLTRRGRIAHAAWEPSRLPEQK